MAIVTIPSTGTGGSVNAPIAVESNAAGMYQLIKLVDPSVGSLDPIGNVANPLYAQFATAQPVVGSVGATQLGAPWSMIGSVAATQAGAWTFIGSATTQSSITVFQGAPVWIITGSVYATGSQQVTGVGGSISALIQGSLTAYQGNAPWSFTGSAFTSSSGDAGDTSHGSLDPVTSNPVKIGGYSISSVFPTAVASSGIRVNAVFDRVGRQIIANWAPLTLSQNKHNDFTGPLSGTIVWTPGVANRVCVTDLRVVAGSGTAGIVTLYYARSGAPINFTVASGVCLFRGEMAPSATAKPGAVITFPFPAVGDANDALRISITTTMQVYVQAGGFEAP